MSTTSTTSTALAAGEFIDHKTGKRVMEVMRKYVGTELTEETTDHIMADILTEFGNDLDAQVMIDTDTTEIEIIVRDIQGRLIKCSSLTLFKDMKCQTPY